MKFEKLENICTIRNGYAFKSDKFTTDGVAIIRISDIQDNFVTTGKSVRTPFYPVFESFRINKGDILIAMSGATTGKFGIYDSDEIAFQNQRVGLFKINDNNILNSLYLFQALKLVKPQIEKKAYGGGQPNISAANIGELKIPLPSISDQLHVASLLSKAENLITLRKQSIALLDEFLKSTFLEMFGDPGFNKKRWNKLTLKELSLRFSDGPFGSNLKTEHYSDSGIQVIRLQNIGINKFVEKDVSYVTEPHYEKVLKKYSCFPDDVVIATMGSPNVRACIIPKHVKMAINKADCVLFRVNPKLANQYYISHLLNQDGFLSLATSYIHGQTRARISSGQLAIISIPVPPLELQTQFAQIVEKTEALKAYYQSSLQELENLYDSLSQRTFKGELNLNEQLLMAAEPMAEYQANVSI